PDARQLRPSRTPERPERRGPRLAPARPPRHLHPDLRRQEGARARQVHADRRPQPPRERLHHPLPPPPDRLISSHPEGSDGRVEEPRITRIHTNGTIGLSGRAEPSARLLECDLSVSRLLSF